jgi:hypothetical protein
VGIGGSGNFGARIVRELRNDPDVEVIVAGRRTLDIESPGLGERLEALKPQLVIHCVGPFQQQSYRVAVASLAVGAHYIDLADGRQFVANFSTALHERALAAGRSAISGASTLPALSSAVVQDLQTNLSALDSIEVAIAPGHRAPRGPATLAGVLSYLGRPYTSWHDGRWKRTWGWMDLRKIPLDIGTRFGASCNVPDLELFPQHFRGVQSVSFHAALEFTSQQLVLWSLAGLRRAGLPLPVAAWAAGLDRWASLYDARAGDKGGMWVRVIGRNNDGRRVQRTWNLVAPALHGPEIPSMPAVLLARRLARGPRPLPGAYACIGILSLSDFVPEFQHWGIRTRSQETPVSLDA